MLNPEIEERILALTEDQYDRYFDMRTRGVDQFDALLEVEEGI